MGNSKHRKNHKQKLANRKRQVVEANNTFKKEQDKMQNFYRQQMMKAQHEAMIESIYKGRPEMSKRVDTKDKEGNDTYTIQLDMDNMVEKEGILYFKESDNPLMSGLAQLEDYPAFDTTYVNMLLERIAYKQKTSALHKANLVATEADINELKSDNESEFELVEDIDSLITDAIIIEETRSDSDLK